MDGHIIPFGKHLNREPDKATNTVPEEAVE
jgi:hypothetical protein